MFQLKVLQNLGLEIVPWRAELAEETNNFVVSRTVANGANAGLFSRSPRVNDFAEDFLRRRNASAP